MRCRLACGLVLIARLARADGDERELANQRAPGFANDPVSQLLAQQLAVRTPNGFSLEGGLPSESLSWIDNFAVPGFHRNGRSTVTAEGADVAIGVDASVDHGTSGAGIVAVSTRDRQHDTVGAVSTRELIAVGGGADQSIVARMSVLGYAAPLFVPDDRELRIDDAPNSQDVQIHSLWRDSPYAKLYATAFASRDQLTYFTDRTDHGDQRVEQLRDMGRATMVYWRGDEGQHWSFTAEHSISESEQRDSRGLFQHARVNQLTFETREMLTHAHGDVAGLSNVSSYVSVEAHVTRHDLDVAQPIDSENIPRAGISELAHGYRGIVWTPDIASSAAVSAKLSAHLDFYGGIRVDAFGSDIALEPRAALTLALPQEQTVQLSAGAYRRGAEHGEELVHSELHPERTTRVSLRLFRRIYSWFYDGELYYVDRTNLIVRDTNGKLANTGYGTTYGSYSLIGHRGNHWVGQVALRLEHADRQDAPRGLVRPFEYSQPIALEARVTRFIGNWSFGARFEVREGLPYSQVVSADYQSDRDIYTPNFDRLYGERLPWQHQLDLRVDHTWGKHWSAYLDIANVYDHRGTVDWAYNFDFSQRRAIQGPPIVPTLGVRGQL